jgi:hypothetical protein
MAHRVISLRCNDLSVFGAMRRRVNHRRGSPFWVHPVFRNFTFCGYGLRLVVGPLASADAAAKLCTTLERLRLTCQPTIFAGRHLALD